MSERKKRGRKILGLAAIGALVAWFARKKANKQPEGTWRDIAAPSDSFAKERSGSHTN